MKVTEVTLELLSGMPIAEPQGETDKDARGRVFIIGGSALSPGAIVLSGHAALRAGAGKVLMGIPAGIAVAVGVAYPEFGILGLAANDDGEPAASDDIVNKLEHCDAVLLGPGMTNKQNARSIARRLLAASDRTVVLDAAAITCFHDDAQTLRSARCTRVITPHAGEIATLTAASRESILADPAGTAARAAHDLGAIVVLKGAMTHIATPDGEVWRHSAGVPGLATAGSGDVLAGLVTGLLARGAPAIPACLWGVYVHAQAGARLSKEVGRLGFLARELSPLFPRLLDDSATSRPPG